MLIPIIDPFVPKLKKDTLILQGRFKDESTKELCANNHPDPEHIDQCQDIWQLF